ncbi:MAG: hypothetical protein ACREA3_02225 [Nitrosotalea sp.]
MSSIHTHRTPNTITTVTVVLLAIIAVAALLQLRIIPPVLSVPLFLIPIAIYTTIIGLKSKHEPHKTQNHSYHFTWAGIMLAIGIGWIILYEGMGATIGAIVVLSIALGYVYLNKIKSSKIIAN